METGDEWTCPSGDEWTHTQLSKGRKGFGAIVLMNPENMWSERNMLYLILIIQNVQNRGKSRNVN